jgi:hypothetical protein
MIRQFGLQNVATQPIGPTLKVRLQWAQVAVAGRGLVHEN